MDEQTRKKILQPYFTTSGGKGGSGIGTMIMQQVLELHGGSITIQSEKGTGTEIIFSLPQSSIKATVKS
jgi:signal transduction histidine kinase